MAEKKYWDGSLFRQLFSPTAREKNCFIYREKKAAITDTKIMEMVIFVLFLSLKLSFIGG